MLPRGSWTGHLRLSLVTVPVQAINAEGGAEGGVNLHQLHAECNSRIQYRKVCPIHGEVPNDEIVYGYEHADDQYVIVDKKDVRSDKKSRDKSINIDTFIALDQLDPMYFEGGVYYLVPDGEVAEKPYAVLQEALTAKNQIGIGVGKFWGRDRLVGIRAGHSMLWLQMLRFASQLREPKTITDEFSAASASKEEVRLASKLIEASIDPKFDLASYEDTATKQLREQIEAKMDEEETVASPATRGKKAPPVINLMDALRRSVSGAKQSGSKTKTGKSKAAPSRRTKTRRSAG